jgi:proline iminopeptidase
MAPTADMHSSVFADRSDSREGYAAVRDGRLFYREIGTGLPTIVLHGGPDFDHRYLLPELDRLSDSLRLLYYDQRGRGRSAPDVEPEAVTIASEIEDLDGLRVHFGLETVALLGHSWGGLLALEYAIQHPHRVSHLVLMNSAPVSHDDLLRFREDRQSRAAADLMKMREVAATARYESGDLKADAEYYRIHFRTALRRPEHLEQVVARLRLGFTPASIRKARAIETRLYEQTWSSSEYDLLPQLEQLRIPTLVIHGNHDFVPQACTEHIAHAIPGAKLVTLSESGHFSYLECPDEVHKAVVEFLDTTSRTHLA